MTGEVKFDPIMFAQQLGGLTTAVENLTSQWGEQDRKASEGRDKLYQQIGGLRTDLAAFQAQFAALTERVASLTSTVRATDAAVTALQLAAAAGSGSAASIPASIKKSRLAVYASIGLGTVVMAAWVLEAVVKWGVGLILSHLR